MATVLEQLPSFAKEQPSLPPIGLSNSIPTGDDPANIGSNFTKLTNVEAQRIMSVLNEIQKKVLIIGLLPDYQDKRINTVFFGDILQAVVEQGKFEQKYKSLLEHKELLESKKEPIEAVQVINIMLKIKNNTNAFYFTIKTEIRETSRQLKNSTRSLYRQFLQNPASISKLRYLRNNKSTSISRFEQLLQEVRTLVYDRLRTTVEEENNKQDQLSVIIAKEQKTSNEVRALQEELEKARRERSNEISKRNEVIRKLKEDLRQIKHEAEETTKRLETKSKQKENNDVQKFQDKETTLCNEIESLKLQLSVELKKNREEEESLRKKKFKIESEVENWIHKFDTEMEEKQTELEDITALFTERKKELDELQLQYNILHVEYEKIIEERKIADEKRKIEEAILKKQSAACVIIQSTWRGYKVRKDLKKKNKEVNSTMFNNTLNFSHSKITKIENLPTSLQSFKCHYNRITKIENLPTNLQSFICHYNRISKIENLSSFLMDFNCNHNHITKIAHLPDLLQEFSCEANLITIIENLPTSLLIFNCRRNKIPKIENLPGYLQEFNCAYNFIILIENLPSSLLKFQCDNNQITKIKNLPSTLKEFICHGNQITKIENLPTSLKIFECSNNQISKIENISPNLQYFNCCVNRITKIENLPSSLLVIFCYYNQISKVENLPLTLRQLHSNYNPITVIENLPMGLINFEFDEEHVEFVIKYHTGEYANSLKIKQLHLISTQPQQLSAEVVLRFYQLQALQWMINLYDNNLSGILADEMGLGKTIQAISFLTYLKFDLKIPNVQFLVVSPLSVLQNWSEEITKFSSGLNLFSYHGSKLERIELRELIQNKLVEFDVLLTTYETVINDIEFFEDKSIFNWTFLIVDEAHRLKNRESLLFKSLLNLNIKHQLLLTGTPIMNNLMELHSLLYFANPLIFDVDPKEFSSWFTTGDAVKGENLSNLRSILKIFMLRREKDQVLSLPSVKETVIYTNLSSLQKKIYKGILMKDLSVFNEKKKLKLMNVLMQLRKCVNHPYLFPGVEPEPFICGEHLVDVSSKLQVLDRLLNYFKSKKRKILIFSQMTQMLDILQDYLTFRRYSYERLDGSVRGEERFLAIKNFQEKKNDTFVFLLSTRAGGVGVNLTEASCVIFFDSDFNPQMDAQAQARAHRIGQLNEVLVIRL
ncbi:Chromodomain-helicase-DNA-binding protein 1-like [Clydaea vesicula]|uniref:Chromodomain-helicase-DNA-binding protein 1-like n=1 Tax=Clydaea vesicula TaxID=447962 RepID=A0AAD5U085_9FUNG|nr:Chromodomain-helicase-DNA-binding protein 1-like [Clydaea vesicula]